LQEDQQRQSSPSPVEDDEEAVIDIAEEGQELGDDNLVPVALVKSQSYDDDGNADARDNERIVHSKAEDDNVNDDSEAAVMAANSSNSRPPKRKGKSPCQSRRNKFFALMAFGALLVVVALSSGIDSYIKQLRNDSSNNGSGGGEVSSANMAVMESTGDEEADDEEVESSLTPSLVDTEDGEETESESESESEPTDSPSTSPILPVAEVVSNDYQVETVSNDFGLLRDRRLRGVRRRNL